MTRNTARDNGFEWHYTPDGMIDLEKSSDSLMRAIIRIAGEEGEPPPLRESSRVFWEAVQQLSPVYSTQVAALALSTAAAFAKFQDEVSAAFAKRQDELSALTAATSHAFEEADRILNNLEARIKKLESLTPLGTYE